MYHQQTTNLLVSYSPKMAGLFQTPEKGRLTRPDARQAPLSDPSWIPPSDAADETAENFDRVNSVNLRGVWAAQKHELRQMRTQGSGAIVNCSSLGSRGQAEAMAAIMNDQPIGRLGQAEEVAAALWLCSPGAGFVIGVALPVDGGYTTH